MTIKSKWEAERRRMEKAFEQTSVRLVHATKAGNKKEAERQAFELYQVIDELLELSSRKEH